MGCIVIGVTGGIAAYKAVEVARRLTQLGFTVRVVMTQHATHLVGPATFRAITGNRVVTSLFEEGGAPMQHLSLAQEADLIIVAPATANILAKIANGIADDLLSTTLLATRAPMLVAPAMNSNMYNHPATQANIRKMVERGVQFIGPQYGSLACGEEGEGRMVDPIQVVETALEMIGLSSRLTGLKILITAGGTREPLDPVRFIGNRSSGRMGYALAETARNMGARVTLVSGPTHLDEPGDVELVKVNTAEEMTREVMGRAPDCSIVVMAAAVADFTPRHTSQEKMHKKDRDKLILELMPTPDILKELGKIKKPGQIVIGFAAETGKLRERARNKLVEKNVDLLVANDVSGEGVGFDSDYNRALILFKDGREIELDTMPKRDLARHVWNAAIELLDGGA